MAKQISKRTNKTILGIGIGILILGGIIWFARPNSQNATASLPEISNGTLSVNGAAEYDFGSISMADGEVSRQFRVRNTGIDAVVVRKVYTSCMCTEATVSFKEKQFGPFGMPGHGFIPKIDQVMYPDEEIMINVVFDPAAHGPAGVGRIQRMVVVENNAGDPLNLSFSATVTP